MCHHFMSSRKEIKFRRNALAHGAMGRRIDPSHRTQRARSISRQYFSTDVCAIVSMVWCI